jgi:hypothetical protein
MPNTLRLLTCVLAAGSIACSIDVRGEGVVSREEKRFTVTGSPELNIRTFDGSITLRSWERNEVLVEIERRGPDTKAAEALVVTTTQEGNRIVVEASEPRVRREGIQIGWQSASVSLTITGPRKTTVEARTGDGSISAENLLGTVGLNSGDGSIRGRRLEGTVRARTGDGSISIVDASGRVEVDSGDGSIELEGRLESLDVRTGDGSVRVAALDGSALKEDWSIDTGDGSIALRLPSGFDAEIDAHTGDGGVHASGFDGLSTPPRDGADSGSLRGRIGKGGRTLRLRSGDGSINISR